MKPTRLFAPTGYPDREYPGKGINVWEGNTQKENPQKE